MSITKEEARKLLQENGLRVTGPRLAVLTVLKAAKTPLSHTEVLELLAETDWDPATIYRNLVKLRESGLAVVASHANGIDRYALSGAHGQDHGHPHFICQNCGQVACLPVDLSSSLSTTGRWSASVSKATIQLRGECPDCLEDETTSSKGEDKSQKQGN